MRVLAASEGLEHADALDRLLDVRGEVSGLVTGAAGRLAVGAAQVEREQDHDDRADEVEQAERRGVDDHERDTRDDRDDRHDHHDEPERDPPAHGREITHRALDQLTARGPVVEADREIEQAVVEVDAHVVLRAGGRRRDEDATAPDEECLEQTEDEHEGGGPDQPGDRAGVQERSFDDHLEDLGDSKGKQAREQSSRATEGDPGKCGARPVEQAQHRCRGRAGGVAVGSRRVRAGRRRHRIDPTPVRVPGRASAPGKDGRCGARRGSPPSWPDYRRG